MPATFFYFGCIERSGHFLFRSDDGFPRKTDARWFHSWMNLMDGKLAPLDIDEMQGPTARHVMHGHTVLSFWDRSVDHRPACNSILFVPGIYSFDTAVELAERAFPQVFRRLKFELTEHVYDV